MKNILKDVGCEASFSQEKHPLENCFSVNLTSNEAQIISIQMERVISDASIASAYGEYIEDYKQTTFL